VTPSVDPTIASRRRSHYAVADRRGSRVEPQLAGHRADRGIFKVRRQATNRIRREALSRIGKHQQGMDGCLDRRIESAGLSRSRQEQQRNAVRVSGKLLGRVVAGTIRRDDDLQAIRRVFARQDVLDTRRQPPRLVARRDDDADAG
jgi:hypothetical protein